MQRLFCFVSLFVFDCSSSHEPLLTQCPRSRSQARLLTPQTSSSSPSQVSRPSPSPSPPLRFPPPAHLARHAMAADLSRISEPQFTK